jgi:hypothetical protein
VYRGRPPPNRDRSTTARDRSRGWKLVSDVNLEQQTEFVGLAADIVSSYVANNNLQPCEVRWRLRDR